MPCSREMDANGGAPVDDNHAGNDRGSGARMTLARHILASQRQHPRARGELSIVLLQLAFAGKIFPHAIRRAAFTGQLGATGERNVQGEATKKLDVPFHSIHQRVPFAAGSRDDVAMLERLTRDDR